MQSGRIRRITNHVYRNKARMAHDKKYWISVYFNQDVPDEKIKELVSKSYDIVVKSLTKKEREMLLSSGE
jgi:predicted DNA-binding protein (MmcQ/YjbR family)